jgi:hypothetical protein
MFFTFLVDLCFWGFFQWGLVFFLGHETLRASVDVETQHHCKQTTHTAAAGSRSRDVAKSSYCYTGNQKSRGRAEQRRRRSGSSTLLACDLPCPSAMCFYQRQHQLHLPAPQWQAWSPEVARLVVRPQQQQQREEEPGRGVERQKTERGQ